MRVSWPVGCLVSCFGIIYLSMSDVPCTLKRVVQIVDFCWSLCLKSFFHICHFSRQHPGVISRVSCCYPTMWPGWWTLTFIFVDGLSWGRRVFFPRHSFLIVIRRVLSVFFIVPLQQYHIRGIWLGLKRNNDLDLVLSCLFAVYASAFNGSLQICTLPDKISLRRRAASIPCPTIIRELRNFLCRPPFEVVFVVNYKKKKHCSFQQQALFAAAQPLPQDSLVKHADSEIGREAEASPLPLTSTSSSVSSSSSADPSPSSSSSTDQSPSPSSSSSTQPTPFPPLSSSFTSPSSLLIVIIRITLVIIPSMIVVTAEFTAQDSKIVWSKMVTLFRIVTHRPHHKSSGLQRRAHTAPYNRSGEWIRAKKLSLLGGQQLCMEAPNTQFVAAMVCMHAGRFNTSTFDSM